MWGEHLHHGLYPGGKPRKDHVQAQVDMVDATLSWAGVSAVTRCLDVGCGLGGSSRHIATRYGADTCGVTLSPVQVTRANALSSSAGLADRCSFAVADALALPFPDNSFDLVWSMESGEHMPNKRRFVGEMARACAPGGRVLMVTWCRREGKLSFWEQLLLKAICYAYHLPPWVPMSEYTALGEELGLTQIKTADWSRDVAPFWRAVMDSALTWKGITGVLRSGLGTLQGALVMPLMQAGLRTGLIKFELMTGVKPAAKAAAAA
jgi:tocopherol O-methyltransferase